MTIKIKPNETDELNAALGLVVELAFQNITDRLDNPREYRRQMQAVRLVQETFHVGDTQ